MSNNYILDYETTNPDDDSVSNIEDLFLLATQAFSLAKKAQEEANKQLLEDSKKWLLETCEHYIRAACSNGQTSIIIAVPDSISSQYIIEELEKAGYSITKFNDYQIQLDWFIENTITDEDIQDNVEEE